MFRRRKRLVLRQLDPRLCVEQSVFIRQIFGLKWRIRWTESGSSIFLFWEMLRRTDSFSKIKFRRRKKRPSIAEADADCRHFAVVRRLFRLAATFRVVVVSLLYISVIAQQFEMVCFYGTFLTSHFIYLPFPPCRTWIFFKHFPIINGQPFYNALIFIYIIWLKKDLRFKRDC